MAELEDLPPELLLMTIKDFEKREGTRSMVEHFRGINKTMRDIVDQCLLEGTGSYYPHGLVLQIHKNVPSLRSVPRTNRLAGTEAVLGEIIEKIRTSAEDIDIMVLINYNRYINEQYDYTDDIIEELKAVLHTAIVTAYTETFGTEPDDYVTMNNRLLLAALANQYMLLHVPIVDLRPPVVYYQIVVLTDAETTWRPTIRRNTIDVNKGRLLMTTTMIVNAEYAALAGSMMSVAGENISKVAINKCTWNGQGTGEECVPVIAIEFTNPPDSRID